MFNLELWKEFGLPGLIMFAVITLLFFVIKWTLSTTKEIMSQAAKERESWIRALAEHTEQAKSFHAEVKEAHSYQREEHKEMIRCLGRINGWTDDKH